MKDEKPVTCWKCSNPPFGFDITGKHPECSSCSEKYNEAKRRREQTRPISLSDLEQRLKLCQRYGVTCYRDGILSLDLTSNKMPAKSMDPALKPLPE